MTSGWEISKDTWDHMPQEQRDWILFDTMQKMCTRMNCLEASKDSRKWGGRLWSFAGGVVGGVAAVFGREVIR